MEIAAKRVSAERRQAQRELKAALRPIVDIYRSILSPTDAVAALATDLSLLLPQFEVRRHAATAHGRYTDLLRVVETRGTMLEAHGGSVSAEHVGRLLNLSKTRVLHRHKQGSLLGVRIDKQNAVRFPIWQFGSDPVHIRPGVAETIALFRARPDQTDWSILMFFVGSPGSPSKSRPLEFLEKRRVADLLTLARIHLKTISNSANGSHLAL